MPQNDRIMTIDQNGATRRRDYRSGRVRTDEPERLKLKFMGKEGFALGRQNVDLRYIEQIVDAEQTASLGLLLKYVVEHEVDGQNNITEIVQTLMEKIHRNGLNFTCGSEEISGGYAIPRKQEIYACLNRYRRN